jgi:signal peptidase I
MESSTALLDRPLALTDPVGDADARPERRSRLAGRLTVRRVGAVLLVACVAGGLGYLRAFPPAATVMSGSMSPTIDTGDVVVFKHIDGKPRVGDVIHVKVPDAARSRYGYPPEVVHRIVRITPDGRITTKGDARREPDPFTIDGRSVDTKVFTTIPSAGRAMAFLTSTLGLIWLGLGALLLIVVPLFDRQREAQQAEQEGIEELGSEVHVVLEEVVRLQAQVSSEAYARAELERTLRELNAGTVMLREELVAALAASPPAVADPEPVAEPVTVESDAVTVEPPAETVEFEAVTIESAAITIEPEPVTVEPEAITIEPEPATVEPEPAAAPAPPPVVRRRSGGLVGRARATARNLRG